MSRRLLISLANPSENEGDVGQKTNMDAQPSKESTVPTPRIGLREVFGGVTLIAVSLAMFRAVGIAGALLVFVGAIIFSIVSYQHVQNGFESWRLKSEFYSDALWGIAMPTICLFFDPGFFRDANYPSVSGLGRGFAMAGGNPVIYSAIGIQMAALFVWMVAGHVLRKFAGLFSGVFLVGMIVSGGIGAILLPFSLLGLFFFGIGLLGLTPLFTSRTFGRRTAQAFHAAPPTGKWLLFVTGLLVAVGIPSIVALGFGVGKLGDLFTIL